MKIYLVIDNDSITGDKPLEVITAYSNEQQAKIEVVLLNRTTYRDRYSIQEVDLV